MFTRSAKHFTLPTISLLSFVRAWFVVRLHCILLLGPMFLYPISNLVSYAVILGVGWCHDACPTSVGVCILTRAMRASTRAIEFEGIANRQSMMHGRKAVLVKPAGCSWAAKA